MIALRYRLKHGADEGRGAERSPSKGSSSPPARSSSPRLPISRAVRAAVEELGLTAAAMLASAPSVPMHEADVPRVAIYTSWSGTQEIGWVRFTFDKFGIPFDLIYKERVKKGNLRGDYDVIVMPTQNVGRAAVFAPPAARPVSYVKSDKYKFLGMYGSSEDITGGFGAEGVDAFQQFLNAGGTLITMGNAVRFPAELGMARTVDASAETSANFYAPRPIVNAEVLRLDHPVFYGYTERIMPIKYLGGPLLSVGEPDRGERPRALRRGRRRGPERPDARRRRNPRPSVRRRLRRAAILAKAGWCCSRTTRSTAGRTTASSTWCSTPS